MNKKTEVNFKYVEAHTGKNDEDSIGNSIADQLASQALKEYSNKFDNFNKLNSKSKDLKSKPGDISKYFS